MTRPKGTKGRRALLNEGQRLEERLGWAPGTLSNPDGWPPIPRPLTKRQLAKQEREYAERLERQRLEWEAEQREHDIEVGSLLLEWARDHLTPGLITGQLTTDDDGKVKVAKAFELFLTNNGGWYLRRDYDYPED